MNRILSSAIILLALNGFLLTESAAPQDASDWSRPMRLCWRFATDEMSFFPNFFGAGRNSFLPLADGSLLAIETSSGKVIWRSEFGGSFAAAPILSDERIFLVTRVPFETSERYILRAVSPQTGLTIFQKDLALKKTEKFFLKNSEKLLYIFTDSGFVAAFDKTNGSKVFERDFKLNISATPLIKENKIFIGSEENKILILRADGAGAPETFETEFPVAGGMELADGRLFFGDRIGNIYAYSLSEREIQWKFRTGAALVDIIAVGENILAASNDGFVYMLSQKSGNRVWKQRLAGRFIGKILLNHRFLLVQTLDGDTLPVISAEKGKTVNNIRLLPDSYAINGAAGDETMIVIPTNRGLQAYANICAGQ
jgi:hypothetical protein